MTYQELNDVKLICAFIPYFENIDPDTACYIDTNKTSVPHPIYSQEFIYAYYDTNLIVKNYVSELDKRIPNWETIDVMDEVSKIDYDTLKVILTKLVRVERFYTGAWDNAIRNGLFLSILRRFKELIG